MGLEQYITRRNTIFFSTAALVSSFIAVRYKQAEQERKNQGTFYVAPGRSGGGV